MKKKQKKEPNGVLSNLNILLGTGPCAQPKSRIKNIFKALEAQLEAEEFTKLKELYGAPDEDGSFVVSENTAFYTYAKKLMHKYAKSK